MTIERLLPLLAVACGARTELDAPLSSSTGPDGGATTCVPSACVDDDIATGLAGGLGIAVDCEVVFWGTDDGKVYRHDTSGNHQIADGVYAEWLALDDADVLAAGSPGIVAVARSGGDVRNIGTGVGPLRVRDGRLYFVDPALTSIASMALTGSPADVVVGALTNITDYDLDDTNVVVAADHAIFLAKRGSSDAPVALATTEGSAHVALVGSQVYIADDGTFTLRSVPISGGSATSCEMLRDDSPAGILADSSGIYYFGGLFNASSIGWLDHESLDCTTGAPFASPADQSEWVAGLATSATAVYWTLIYQNDNLPKPSSFVTVHKRCKPPG